MNTLSWMIYLASVFDCLGNALMATGIGGLLVVCTVGIVSMSLGEYDKTKVCFRLGFGFLVVILVACFVPDKKTMYMIAGSEASETVMKSPTGEKTVALVNSYLDAKLKEINHAEQDAEGASSK